MFPLLERDRPNPFELFQIWLNLSARSKMVEPAFNMFWAEDVPRLVTHNGAGSTEVVCIVGAPGDASVALPPSPPPDSWAADPTADLAIWTIKMEPGARWTLPPASGGETRRQLFFFKGSTVGLNGQIISSHSAIEVQCSQVIDIVNGDESGEFLMLQGRPIGEPVVQDGPFVMNTSEEIDQAYRDYRQTRFGGWTWPSIAPIHGFERKKFVKR